MLWLKGLSMIRFVLYVSILVFFCAPAFCARPVHTPVNSSRSSSPRYLTSPAHGAYNRSVEGKLYTAKDYWASKRRQFEEKNKKNSSSKQTSSKASSNKASDTGSSKKSTGNSSLKPVQATPPPGVIDSSKLVGDGSFERSSIASILTEQLGVSYSSDGETPEDGFSPVGLIKYVALRMGVVPRVSTAAGMWEKSGDFIQVPYGQFHTADILFYKLFSKSAQKDELFVALALDDTYMVYPSFSRNKVIKRSYKDDFWKKHFIGAKRIRLQFR